MYKRWIFLLLVFFTVACTSKTDRLQEQIALEVPQVEKKLEQLESNLNNGLVTNATLLQDYARKLKQLQPENATLIDNLAKNASPSGPMVTNLKQRLQAVKGNSSHSLNQLEENLGELTMLSEALNPQMFNDALSDSINVLADLSKGELPRVQAVSQAAEQRSNAKAELEPGAQLIGNPQYGHWVTGSNGMSFWEWYGMYALFSNLTGGQRHYYHDWSGRRSYSYYHDYGRYRYTKPSNIRQQAEIESKTAKSFQQQGKRFNSPYASKRTGASSLSKVSQSRPSSGSFRKSSTFRNSSSSSGRRGSSRTSRGPSRGK